MGRIEGACRGGECRKGSGSTVSTSMRGSGWRREGFRERGVSLSTREYRSQRHDDSGQVEEEEHSVQHSSHHSPLFIDSTLGVLVVQASDVRPQDSLYLADVSFHYVRMLQRTPFSGGLSAAATAAHTGLIDGYGTAPRRAGNASSAGAATGPRIRRVRHRSR